MKRHSNFHFQSCTWIFLLLPFCLSAQDILWEKSYGGKNGEYLFDAIATPDYGFILAGSSLSKKTGTKTEDNRGDLDYWVWKMDEKGEPDWQKSLGGSGQDMLQSILLTNDGGFLLAGSSESGPKLHAPTGAVNQQKNEVDFDKKDYCRGGMDFWIIKLDAKGNEQWQKTIGGPGNDQLNRVLKVKDGGFLLAGSSDSGISKDKTSENFGGLDYWVIKIDSKGGIVWQNSFGGIYDDDLRSVVAMDDSGFILGGNSNSPESATKTQKNIGESDYWIIKIDENGREQWQKTYGGKGDDALSVLYRTRDGNVFLGGNSNSESGDSKKSGNQSGTDFWVLQLDTDGNVKWQETYNIAKSDILTSIIENADGTLLLGGYAQGEIEKQKVKQKIQGKANLKMRRGTDDYVAIKIKANGEEVWRKEVGSDGQDVLIKAFETRDGGYLMAGTSKTTYSADGSLKATGDKSSGIGSTDFWVVKLKDRQKPKVVKDDLEAIPNPATAYTNVIVGYEFTKGTVTLVDLAGHILQQFPVNTRTIPIDLSGLPEGVYIANIKTDKGSGGVKVIKQSNKN